MIRQPGRHRWCPRLPTLDGTCPGHWLQLWQGQAQAGVGQDKIMIRVEECQLLTQPRFVFTQRIDPPTDRRHMLAKI
jgi:hypothetical protein